MSVWLRITKDADLNVKNLTVTLCLTTALLVGTSGVTMGQTITLESDANVRPDPCSLSESVKRIKKGTSLEITGRAQVWHGAIGVIWYKVTVSKHRWFPFIVKSGWISNQNTTAPNKPIWDKSGIGKKCRWKEN